MARKRISVTQETGSGRNQKFHDNSTGKDFTRAQLVGEINQGKYEGYHVRKVNGLNTPVSNPDSKKGNNLG